MPPHLHDELFFRSIRLHFHVRGRTPNERSHSLYPALIVHGGHLNGDAGVFPRVEQFKYDALDARISVEITVVISDAGVVEEVHEELRGIVEVLAAPSENRKAIIE